MYSFNFGYHYFGFSLNIVNLSSDDCKFTNLIVSARSKSNTAFYQVAVNSDLVQTFHPISSSLF